MVMTKNGWTCICTLLVLQALALVHVHAVVPTGEIAFQMAPPATGDHTMHDAAPPKRFANMMCSPSAAAGWGVPLPEIQNSRWKHMFALPESNAQGCAPYTLPSWRNSSDLIKTLVIADRGNCSFLTKAQVAQDAGAKGLIVRGTKRAVYDAIQQRNNTMNQTTEKPAFEYDCSRGEAFVAQVASPEWQTDDPACAKSKSCDSHACILTGHVDAAKGGHQVCCMWDTYLLMGANRTDAANISIPVVFVTMNDGLQLDRMLEHHSTDLMLVRTYRRPLPILDISSILLWVLGVATALGASYYSALPNRRQMLERMCPPEQRKQLAQQERLPQQEETLELDTKHAFAFIACAGVFLTILYFVKVGRLIPILFAFSATVTLTQLVMSPGLDYFVPSIASRHFVLPSCMASHPDETIALSEVLGLVASGLLALIWYLNRRTCWLLQNLFGMALCFVFLRTIQLPNLKVATILLSCAFLYDIFFVFISPAIFGSSVMEDVATGGPSASTRDDYPGADYCERYPQYPSCIDPEPMPMLLVLPRILDWSGGVSMLGLGDIIIPGMLLSFALRFDYSPKSLGENYYQIVCIGYAVGLAMANIAVSLMQMGQPALMYLVPTCLGSLLVFAWRNGDFKAMWLGIGLTDNDEEDDKTYDDHDEEAAMKTQRLYGEGSRETTTTNRTLSPAVNDGAHDHAPLLGQ